MGAAIVTVITTLSLSCCLEISLKPLLDAVKHLQIIVNIMLIDLYMYAKTEKFYARLREIMYFQAIDPTSFLVKYLPIKIDKPVSIHFEDTGYEYSDCTLNMGPISIVITASIILILLCFILSLICCFPRPK